MSTGANTSLSYDTRTPSLVDVVRAAMRETEFGLNVSFPATVSKLNGDGTVNVVSDFLSVLWTDSGEQEQPAPEIPSVPIWTYGRNAMAAPASGYLQFPVGVGDKGLILVSDRSIDAWYETGIQGAPPAYHSHKAIDGFFIPGNRQRTKAIDIDQTAAVLEASLVKIGEGASLGAARTSDSIVIDDAAWLAWFIAVGTATGVAPPGAPPTGLITGGSSKVLVE